MDHTEFNDEVDDLYRGNYAGLPIADLNSADVRTLAAGEVVWQISEDVYDSEETFEERFGRFLETVSTAEVKAIIIGGWGEAYESNSS